MPMKRELYPRNWDEIATQVKKSANWHCQECGKPCQKPDESKFDLYLRLLTRDKAWLDHLYDESRLQHFTRFVLTVAHLDQTPANCDPSNLKALCSVCHLKYDNRARAEKRRMVSGGGDGT